MYLRRHRTGDIEMNKKLTGLVLGTALSALAFSACETAPTNSNATVNGNRVNSNTAVVVNSNTNTVTTNTGNSNMWANTNSVTRADYDRDRAKYEAEKGTSSIGQGANDSWIWFKTRSALATTADLRESTVNVDVTNDMITLKGTVATAEQKAKAETVAKGIEGNKGVKNELKVAANDSITNVNTNSAVNGNGNTKK